MSYNPSQANCNSSRSRRSGTFAPDASGSYYIQQPLGTAPAMSYAPSQPPSKYALGAPTVYKANPVPFPVDRRQAVPSSSASSKPVHLEPRNGPVLAPNNKLGLYIPRDSSSGGSTLPWVGGFADARSGAPTKVYPRNVNAERQRTVLDPRKQLPVPPRQVSTALGPQPVTYGGSERRHRRRASSAAPVPTQPLPPSQPSHRYPPKEYPPTQNDRRRPRAELVYGSQPGPSGQAGPAFNVPSFGPQQPRRAEERSQGFKGVVKRAKSLFRRDSTPGPSQRPRYVPVDSASMKRGRPKDRYLSKEGRFSGELDLPQPYQDYEGY